MTSRASLMLLAPTVPAPGGPHEPKDATSLVKGQNRPNSAAVQVALHGIRIHHRGWGGMPDRWQPLKVSLEVPI